MSRRDARKERAPRAQLWLRVELGDGHRIGPGKVQLLERIAEHGSISAAGRSMQMSYRRAWLLVESINASFREPAVVTQQGGSAGGGAALNGRAIHVSAAGAMIDSLLATGFACVRDDLLDNNLAIFERIVRRVQGVRRGGSAALDLAYVAAGRFDGFWELNLSRWDTSAGVLLVREAGGVVTDFEGEGRFVEKREIVASNGALHEPLLEAIRAARAPVARRTPWRGSITR